MVPSRTQPPPWRSAKHCTALLLAELHQPGHTLSQRQRLQRELDVQLERAASEPRHWVELPHWQVLLSAWHPTPLTVEESLHQDPAAAGQLALLVGGALASWGYQPAFSQTPRRWGYQLLLPQEQAIRLCGLAHVHFAQEVTLGQLLLQRRFHGLVFPDLQDLEGVLHFLREGDLSPS